MKTGKVAKLFGRDANTISDWTDRYAEFFSAQARAQGRSQRDYQPDDLIVINTIRVGRDQDNATWEEIEARLRNKDLQTELPPTALDIEGQSAVTVYTQMKALEARNSLLEDEIERLRAELGKQTEESEKLRSEEREKLQSEIIRLNREIAVLEYRMRQSQENNDE